MTDLVDSSTVARTLRRFAAETELRGQPSAGSLDAVRESSGFRLATPHAWGGADLGLPDLARILVDLGAGCASTAWVVATNATARMLVEGSLPGAVIAELYGDADAIFCGSATPPGTAVPVPGGFEISGRWPIVSGCEAASWGVFAAHAITGATPMFSLTVLPMNETTVQRSWNRIGMRGTGSHAVVAKRVFVPAEQVVPFIPATAAQTLRMKLTHVAPIVGAAYGALDAATVPTGGPADGAVRPGSAVGDAECVLTNATSLFLEACDTVQNQLDNGTLSDANDPSGVPARVASACRRVVGLVISAYGLHGSSNDDRLQRLWRDVTIGTQHPDFRTATL